MTITKGQIRKIRKFRSQIEMELNAHKGTEAEYAKVPHGNGSGYFVIHRPEFDQATKGM